MTKTVDPRQLECYIGDRVLCLQVHGDAAFTGQGVVMESLGMRDAPIQRMSEKRHSHIHAHTHAHVPMHAYVHTYMPTYTYIHTYKPGVVVRVWPSCKRRTHSRRPWHRWQLRNEGRTAGGLGIGGN
jgi:hypothetical protein